MESRVTYLVSSQFSRFPGGRRRAHGAFSGEAFREDVTIPLLREFEFVKFDLSDSKGYSSGFLDEAFGEIGAILGLSEARRRVSIVASDDDESIKTCWERIEDASREAGKK